LAIVPFDAIHDFLLVFLLVSVSLSCTISEILGPMDYFTELKEVM